MINKTLKVIVRIGVAIAYFCEYIISFVLYILVCLRHWEKPSRLPYRFNESSKRLAVFANGPSLNSFLDEIEEGKDVSQWDFSCMNYFGEHDLFAMIKPKYYCLADPMFFLKDNRYEKVMHLFRTINERVDWDMTVFIPSCFSKRNFLSFSGLSNSHCKVVPVRYIRYRGNLLKHWLYNKNFAMPNIPTVAILNLYTGINLGYKEIDLFGADMTFLDSMYVDENNRLCNKIKHFYDNEPQIKPITFGDDKVVSVGFYLKDVCGMFYGHYEVEDYAKYQKVEIINRSKVSLLDCYKRI